MLIIGLTGGIGSGKSSACEYFIQQGIPVIDADIIAHQLVEPDSPALFEIIKNFGADFINSNGRLNRDKLRTEVFSDPKKRQQLEAIIHPRVFKEIQNQLANITTAYCVLCIPLLLETGATYEVNRVLVIDINEATQIERVMARDKLTREQIQSIINTQINRSDRLKQADDIINNDAQPEDFQQQLASIHKKYLSLADNTS